MNRIKNYSKKTAKGVKTMSENNNNKKENKKENLDKNNKKDNKKND